MPKAACRNPVPLAAPHTTNLAPFVSTNPGVGTSRLASSNRETGVSPQSAGNGGREALVIFYAAYVAGNYTVYFSVRTFYASMTSLRSRPIVERDDVTERRRIMTSLHRIMTSAERRVIDLNSHNFSTYSHTHTCSTMFRPVNVCIFGDFERTEKRRFSNQLSRSTGRYHCDDFRNDFFLS